MVDIGFNMDRLIRRYDHVDPFLVSDLHGHDDNSRNDPSRPCAAKSPTLSGQPSVIDYAIRSPHPGTRNQILWWYSRRTHVLS